MVVPIPRGSVREALLEGAFSEVARASRFLPAYRDTVNLQALASIPEAVRQSSTCRAGLPKRFGSLNPRATPLRTVQRLFDTLPLPDYEPGVRGVTPVHSVTQMMVLGRFSCPGPARPCSEFQLVVATLGLILFPRRRRPLRPSRACRASQLTGYLIASG